MKWGKRKGLLFLFSLFNLFCPKNNRQILFYSYPDLGDNSFALFRHVLESRPGRYQVVWLLERTDLLPEYHHMIEKNVDGACIDATLVRFEHRYSIRGFWALARSRHVFFTHSLFKGQVIPKRQKAINLWHGMPLKTIGHLDLSKDSSDVGICTHTIATSPLFQDVMARAFRLSSDSVPVTGLPRCDWLHRPGDCLSRMGIDRSSMGKVILWAPTYRKIAAKSHLQDGEFSGGLPVIGERDLHTLDRDLAKLNVKMLVKLHPLDALNQRDFESFSNIEIIHDRDLLDTGCQFYSLLQNVDILLTDYSSVYVDFLLTLKPILFITDDLDAYANGRGFVFEDQPALMPGRIVSDYESLLGELTSLVVEERDDFIDERIRINEIFNSVSNNHSERLLENFRI